MSDPAPSKRPVPKVTDEQLIDRYRVGELAAFESLVKRYQQELFHFLIRFTGQRAAAEDVFQDAFVQVHLSIDTFDTSRRFKPWLFTIAANKARDYLRKKARRPAVPLNAPVGDADGQTFADFMEADLPDPGDALQSADMADRVRQVVEQMPDHLREILLLSYFQKFSYQEIADVLGIPLGTVKSRLHSAVGTFAQKWKSANPGDAGT
jgi:RNA polymerase sigma-70 factor (ECF subfamily)